MSSGISIVILTAILFDFSNDTTRSEKGYVTLHPRLFPIGLLAETLSRLGERLFLLLFSGFDTYGNLPSTFSFSGDFRQDQAKPATVEATFDMIDVDVIRNRNRSLQYTERA